MRHLIVTLLFMLQMNIASAADSPLNGVWRGKLGTMDIVACFNGDQSGNYYYTRRKKPIQLSREEHGSFWLEESKTGSWKLEVPAADKLQGIWRDPKNEKTIPIVMGEPSNVADDQPCTSDNYNSALEDFPELKIGFVKPKHFPFQI